MPISTRNSAKRGSTDDDPSDEDDRGPARQTTTQTRGQALPTAKAKANYKQKIKHLETENSDLKAAHEELQDKFDTVMAQLQAARQKGYTKRNTGYADMVKKKTRKELWRICKFMADEKQERQATEVVLDTLKMREFMLTNDKAKDAVILQKRSDFVGTYSNDCREALNDQRSYVQSQMKKVANKLLAKEEDPLPSIEDIYKVATRIIPLLPDDPNDTSEEAVAQRAEHERLMNIFLWYWDDLLPACAGNIYWRDGIRRSQCITVANHEGKHCIPASTEAMTAIMYDNCSEKWASMWDKKKEDPEYKIPKKKEDPDYEEMLPKYSDPAAGQSKYGGWSEEGLLKYSELVPQIKTSRQTTEAAQLERICLQMVKDRYGIKQGDAPKTKKNRGKKRKEAPTSIVVAFDEE